MLLHSCARSAISYSKRITVITDISFPTKIYVIKVEILFRNPVSTFLLSCSSKGMSSWNTHAIDGSMSGSTRFSSQVTHLLMSLVVAISLIALLYLYSDKHPLSLLQSHDTYLDASHKVSYINVLQFDLLNTKLRNNINILLCSFLGQISTKFNADNIYTFILSPLRFL